MYIYEKVRARNFARAWGFAQCAMALPVLLGVPMSGNLLKSSSTSSILSTNETLTFEFSGYMNLWSGNPKSGYYLSVASLVAGCLSLTLVDLHKRRIRRRRKNRARSVPSK